MNKETEEIIKQDNLHQHTKALCVAIDALDAIEDARRTYSYGTIQRIIAVAKIEIEKLNK